jgi:hypothetical protein
MGLIDVTDEGFLSRLQPEVPACAVTGRRIGRGYLGSFSVALASVAVQAWLTPIKRPRI